MFKPPFFNSGFNCDAKEWSKACRTVPVGDSLTVQSQANDADINIIVKRFGVSPGTLFPSVPVPPSFGDFSADLDYRQAMDILNAGQKSFMMLPAEVRARFMNDAGKFVEFCGKPENLDEMRKLGLAVPAKAPVVEKVMKVEVVAGATEAKPKS